jgi:uncharacterized protein (DUF1501 family)
MQRRTFLQGLSAAGLLGLAPGATAWFDPLAAKGGGQNVLVYLFLRGGIDALHLMPPRSGADRLFYENRRGNLAIPAGSLLPLGATDWGLHPRAPELRARFDQGRLAIVQACGMSDAFSRSHFDAMAYIELGTPGSNAGNSGWIARYLGAASGLPSPILASAVGMAGTTPTSLIGGDETITASNAEDFRVDGFHWSWNNTDAGIAGHQAAHTRLLPLWTGSSSLESAGRRAAEALLYMRQIDFRAYHPTNAPTGYQAEGGAVYPSSGDGATLARQLRNIAQLVKLDLGMAVATVDYGGWDTHEGQGMPSSGFDYFGNRVEGLSQALEAFYRDLAGSSQGNLMQRVTVLIQSEFGRRFTPNASSGTDHGYGGLMLALGERVNGGLHGTFPGLADDQLFEGQDVDVTTDFRQVLAEALVRRQGFSAGSLPTVFPGLPALGGYQPLGVFQAG